ncbi:MAG: hypothetical protein H7Y11_10560, partial [Armatimonadetes bacterium]|nr:hypothetical protein [Anaerolineae bacterium]
MTTSQTSAAPVALDADLKPIAKRRLSPWQLTLLRLSRNRSAVIGGTLIALLLLTSLGAPLIATHDPLQPMIGVIGEVPPLPRKAPCVPAFGCAEPIHLMGLDLNARDVFSRIVFGAQTSLFIGVSVTLFAASIGTLIGLVSGYAGGWV